MYGFGFLFLRCQQEKVGNNPEEKSCALYNCKGIKPDHLIRYGGSPVTKNMPHVIARK